MMRKNVFRCLISAALLCCVITTPVSAASVSNAVSGFSVKLLQESKKEGENTLISPFSILSALSMTANGAAGNTLEQMENVLGLSIEQLNDYFKTYLADKDGQAVIANSIWFKNDEEIPVKPEFTQTVSDCYQSEIFEEPMDAGTLQKINDWVNDKTDGMIPEILNEIPSGTLMYLLNALTFQSRWENIYASADVYDGIFTDENGKELETDMMRSTESVYLKGTAAEGFMKYYEGGKYAFAALLPDEGISLDEYTESLTGESLSEILSEKQTGYTIHAEIPKFTSETETELSEELQALGITDAFSDQADFSSMFDTSANPGVRISEVIHKTFIEVNEQETKASAATAVGIMETAMLPDESEKYISLNRPFLYMLVDCEKNIPLFIGTMYTPEE